MPRNMAIISAAKASSIVAGTLAMMVLGGALAELMAIDIMTTAKAGTGHGEPAALTMAAGER